MLGGGLVGASDAPPPCKGFSCSVYIQGAALSRLARRLLARLAGRATFGQAVASVGYLLPTRREGGKQPDPSPPGKTSHLATIRSEPLRNSAQACPCQSGEEASRGP